MDTERLEIHYFQITDIWKRFCEEHSLLLDKTCDEYGLMLDSNVEALENKISEKEEVIQRIEALEQLRAEVIADINIIYEASTGLKITTISDLFACMKKFEEKQNARHLERFNLLLIDIIEKIQSQNKKNQLFINKAISSLQTIREDVSGKKSYQVYTNKGSKTSSVNSV